jgi:hypothetical protein
MLIIKAKSSLETITVWGEVPEHPDVKDIKPYDWSAKPIRPSRIKAVFQRVGGGEWTIASIRLYGFDVLKSGKPSDNDSCWREHQISADGKIHRFTSSVDREQIELTSWARDWAAMQLARINDVTVRADLDSDVYLGESADLDQPQPRRFPLDSPEPRENGLRVQSEVNQVIFRYVEAWGRWVAEAASGGDGDNYSWNALNSSGSEYATGEMVEVL